MDTTYSTELQMLFCAIALGIVQLLIAVLAGVATRGMPWAPVRATIPARPLGKIGGRLERAYRNFLETFVLFAAAVLLAPCARQDDVEFRARRADLSLGACALHPGLCVRDPVPAYADLAGVAGGHPDGDVGDLAGLAR